MLIAGLVDVPDAARRNDQEKMEHLFEALLAWVGQRPAWVLGIVFLASFLESVAVIGTVVPACTALLIAGMLIGVGSLNLWVTNGLAILGAVLGDAMSYWLGHHYHEQIRQKWPFSKYPQIIQHGEVFFDRHGGKSVVIGRFFAPVRAVVPLVAGMLNMPAPRFYFMNILSAFGWAPMHILPGVAFGASIHAAGAVAGRLAIVLLLLTALLWSTAWATRVTLRWGMPWFYAQRKHLLARVGPAKGLLGRTFVPLLDPDQPASNMLLLSLLILLLCLGLFLGVLDNLLAHHVLRHVDTAVFRFMREVRTPWVDQVMVAVSALAGAYTIVPLTLVISGYAIWRHCWQVLAYWLGTLLLAIGLVIFLKLGFIQPHLMTSYTGHEAHTFPSLDATLGAAIYGFLAFILGHELRRPYKLVVATVAASIIALIGFARLYLGAHWLSAVLGGICLGLATSALMGIFYTYHQPPRLGADRLGALALATLAVTFGWHVGHVPAQELAPYMLRSEVITLTETAWRDQVWQLLPAYRVGAEGAQHDPLNVQWVGTRDEVRHQLQQAQWQPPKRITGRSLLLMLAPQTPALAIPVIPRLNAGAPARITMVRAVTGHPERRLVLRLWPSGYAVVPQGAAHAKPLWIGTVTEEQERHALSLVTYTRTLDDRRSPVLDLVQELAAPALAGQVTRESAATMPVLLLSR